MEALRGRASCAGFYSSLCVLVSWLFLGVWRFSLFLSHSALCSGGFRSNSLSLLLNSLPRAPTFEYHLVSRSEPLWGWSSPLFHPDTRSVLLSHHVSLQYLGSGVRENPLGPKDAVGGGSNPSICICMRSLERASKRRGSWGVGGKGADTLRVTEYKDRAQGPRSPHC